MSKLTRGAALGVALSLAAAGAVMAQPKPNQAVMNNASQMKFAGIPDLPTCAEASVQDGDPGSSAFILLAKTKAGCSIPWHWHTANENLMIVTGTAEVAMRDEGKPVDLRAGGFAHLPAKHVHQFRCKQACTFYLYSDGKFDIHYVDPEGNEIPAARALERVKETAVVAQK